jgi:predicted MPP superfamily phosphohydrolase
MNILHITDFHYNSENTLQKKVVSSIIKTIKDIEFNIDVVFFTGDLVQNGSDIELFRSASRELFDKLSEHLSIDPKNIVFCPGNHDINRGSIHGAIKPYLDAKINSEDSLNDFYRIKDDSVFLDSKKPSNNYFNFLSEYHPSNSENIISDLYSIHFRQIGNKKLGIVCLNTAWLSGVDKEKSSYEDKGNLLIPHSLLEEVKKKVIIADKKIILLHHPLYFLKDFNFYRTESFIHNEFDLMFSGHVHKISSISRHSGTNGIFEHVAKASLSSKENLGCSLIVIDEIEENTIRVKELSCIEDDDHCFVSSEIIYTLPCCSEKLEIITFRKKLFDKISIEKENANNLLLVNESIEKEDFLSLYNNPVLKKESENTIESKNAIAYSLEDIILNKSNFVVLGKDKCGKTSLLKRIQLECLLNYSKTGTVPFYYDSRDFESNLESNFEIEHQVRNYFSINKAKVKQLLSSGDFLLLIDNYSPNTGLADYLNVFLTENVSVTFIICTEFNLSRSVDIFQLGGSIYEKLFFHDLRRKEIVSYTNKRLTLSSNKNEVQEKIIQLCKQLELPLNYWTISLLLLIHNKTADSYSKNLFSILEVCIDEIFGKKQLLLTKSKISFEQLKAICAELAKVLFLSHKETIYSAPYQVIVNTIERAISSNDRISANCKDIIDYLISTGILKQKNQNDLYVFRLNGFFEYFLAYQMTKDIDFKEDILKEEVKYLAFKNQLEIYCGFKRDDFDFLKKIYSKSKVKLNSIFNIYSENKDNELIAKIKEPGNIEDKYRNILVKSPLSATEKAEIEDIADELQINSDVHEIREMNPDTINSELIERYLSILSRTFRNLDEISENRDTISEVFRYIINCYCDFGFFLIEEFSAITKLELAKEGELDILNFPELDLLKFISNFSPIMSQIWLFEGIGHFSIERMVKNEIKILEADSNNNQYKLFLLYFLLLDIDLNANIDYIKVAFENVKIPILKYTIYVKLNYYLAFKSGENKILQRELANYIQQAQMNFDSSVKLGDIHKQIQLKKKMSLKKNNKL